MRYPQWNKRKRIEADYNEALSKLGRRISNRLKGAKDIGEIQGLLAAMPNDAAFISFAEKQALLMITALWDNNARTWREAARNSMRGAEIYELLKGELQGNMGAVFAAQVRENAAFITQIPLNISREITRIIGERTIQGASYSDIVKEVRKRLPEISQARAMLIARTEIGKANEAITQARSQELGINWYIWRTAKDGDRVRDAHQLMEGVLVNYNDPPAPEELLARISGSNIKSEGHYNAGNIYNCRCYAEPVIDMKYLPNTGLKVYWGGNIQTMTKNKFNEMFIA